MTCKLKRSSFFITTACVFLLASGPLVAAEKDNSKWHFGDAGEHWRFGAEAYLWMAGIGGSNSAGDDIDVGFGSILSSLELGFMGTFAASKNRWTLFADAIYLDLDDKTSGTVNDVGPPIEAKVDLGLKGFISTMGGAYRIARSDTTVLNLVAGARYLWLDAKLDLNLGELPGKRFSDSGSNWDAIVGLRGITDLSPNWYMVYHGDIGAGSSDSTWQGLIAFSYRFQKFDATFGYRYLNWNFDNSDVFDDLNISGPFAGLKLYF